jgi:hypothetical protein
MLKTVNSCFCSSSKIIRENINIKNTLKKTEIIKVFVWYCFSIAILTGSCFFCRFWRVNFCSVRLIHLKEREPEEPDSTFAKFKYKTVASYFRNVYGLLWSRKHIKKDTYKWNIVNYFVYFQTRRVFCLFVYFILIFSINKRL